ncbi:hypothetical protein HDU85_005892 [Gaertneriomyces sp. JEL0708]|nr:hypothetical protein HDU85_005892 [Gaertneriomyces sp. JEL0708]
MKKLRDEFVKDYLTMKSGSRYRLVDKHMKLLKTYYPELSEDFIKDDVGVSRTIVDQILDRADAALVGKLGSYGELKIFKLDESRLERGEPIVFTDKDTEHFDMDDLLRMASELYMVCTKLSDVLEFYDRHRSVSEWNYYSVGEDSSVSLHCISDILNMYTEVRECDVVGVAWCHIRDGFCEGGFEMRFFDIISDAIRFYLHKWEEVGNTGEVTISHPSKWFATKEWHMADEVDPCNMDLCQCFIDWVVREKGNTHRDVRVNFLPYSKPDEEDTIHIEGCSDNLDGVLHGYMQPHNEIRDKVTVTRIQVSEAIKALLKCAR